MIERERDSDRETEIEKKREDEVFSRGVSYYSATHFLHQYSSFQDGDAGKIKA